MVLQEVQGGEEEGGGGGVVEGGGGEVDLGVGLEVDRGGCRGFFGLGDVERGLSANW